MKQEIWREEYKHLEGQQVDIQIGFPTFLNRTLFFAGTNPIGGDVITTICDRAIFHIKDWNNVKIIKHKL